MGVHDNRGPVGGDRLYDAILLGGCCCGGIDASHTPAEEMFLK